MRTRPIIVYLYLSVLNIKRNMLRLINILKNLLIKIERYNMLLKKSKCSLSSCKFIYHGFHLDVLLYLFVYFIFSDIMAQSYKKVTLTFLIFILFAHKIWTGKGWIWIKRQNLWFAKTFHHTIVNMKYTQNKKINLNHKIPSKT